MSEEVRKSFRMKKTIPGDVILIVHSFSNPQLAKTIHLTKRNPYQFLPLDWALSIFVDDGNYQMYKKGCFTFDHNEELVRAAYEAGAYFDEELDFKPVDEDNTNVIFQMVSSGNRSKLLEAINKYGREAVLKVVIDRREELSMGVVSMCESYFKVQLIIDGDNSGEESEK